jgi:hypothetical protein
MIQFTTQSGRYLVTSHGNGWAYEVVDLQTNDSLWFQDDDANEIQEQTDHFEHEENIAVYFENLCE